MNIQKLKIKAQAFFNAIGAFFKSFYMKFLQYFLVLQYYAIFSTFKHFLHLKGKNVDFENIEELKSDSDFELMNGELFVGKMVNLPEINVPYVKNQALHPVLLSRAAFENKSSKQDIIPDGEPFKSEIENLMVTLSKADPIEPNESK